MVLEDERVIIKFIWIKNGLKNKIYCIKNELKYLKKICFYSLEICIQMLYSIYYRK